MNFPADAGCQAWEAACAVTPLGSHHNRRPGRPGRAGASKETDRIKNNLAAWDLSAHMLPSRLLQEVRAGMGKTVHLTFQGQEDQLSGMFFGTLCPPHGTTNLGCKFLFSFPSPVGCGSYRNIYKI